MKIKISDATPLQINWLVAQIEGTLPAAPRFVSWKTWDNPAQGAGIRPYSADWSQGGPIIERERIRLVPWLRPVGAPMHGYWHTGIYTDTFDAATYSGPTPLIAAMRCFVASKMGDEVEIPDELFKETT